MSESASEMSDISIEPTEPDAARGGGGGGTNATATAAGVSSGASLSGSINGGVGGGDEVEDALESGGTKLLSSDADSKGISVMSASVLLMTWSTSSSNVMYPWTYGVLGVLGGPMLMGAAFLINWQV